MTTPVPATDAELEAAAAAMHDDLKLLGELRDLAANYRATRDTYQAQLDDVEAKLGPIRARLRARMRDLNG